MGSRAKGKRVKRGAKTIQSRTRREGQVGEIRALLLVYFSHSNKEVILLHLLALRPGTCTQCG